MFSLMNFIINKKEFFEIHLYTILIQGINIRLHRLNANLSCFQKSTFYAGVKIVNTPPPSVTILKYDKAEYKAASTKQLHTHCFYCVDEVFMCEDDL